MNLVDIRKGREAADGLLEFLAKAKKPPITTPKGFDAVVIQTLQAIKAEVAGPQADALRVFLQGLEQDWVGMSVVARRKAVDKAAKSWLAVSRRGTPPAVGKVLAAKGVDIVTQTKSALGKKKKKQSIGPSFSLADEAAVEFLAKSQVNYVRDMLGKRSGVLSDIARAVVADGLKNGHDSRTIGAALKENFSTTSVAGKNDNYWRLLSGVFVARARTWSTLSSFQEAGISGFQVEAILDEVTSEVCRYMHGKIFHVGAAMSSLIQSESANDPESVKDSQPWLSVARTGNPDDKEERALFFKQGGAKHAVAIIDEPGVGKKDVVGKYQPLMNDSKLQSSGISSPPYHGHCRTTLVPYFGAATPTMVAGDGAAPPTTEPRPFVFPPPAPPVPRALPAPPPPPVPAGFNDPMATLVFGKTPQPDQVGAMLNGVAFKPASKPEFWKDAKDVELGEQPIVASAGKKPASGVIIMEPDGRMWVVEPKGHYGGYEHTFPKGKTEKGLSDQQNALKEAYEESGLEVEIVGIVGDFEKTTSTTRYYVARRKGGEPWSSHYESQTVKLAPPEELKKLLNTAVDKKVLDAAIAYQQALKEGKPPPPPVTPPKLKTPRAPKPPVPLKPKLKLVPMGDGANIMATNTGGAGGSNTGGFYTGKDGVERYVKLYDNPGQAHGEHLSNQLYRDLGIDAPESELFEYVDEKGTKRTGYASRILPGAKQLREVGLTKERADKILDGFAADAFTANWDAVGLVQDNIVVLPNGKLVRIDNGGTLLYRARGSERPATVRNSLSEWTFLPEKSDQYKAVFQAAGVSGPKEMGKRVAKQIDDILRLERKYDGWDKYVDAMVPTMPSGDRTKVVEMLNARSVELRKKLEEIRPVSEGRFVVGQYSAVTPRAGLTVADLPKTGLIGDYYGKINGAKTHSSGEAYADYKARAAKAVARLSPTERAGIKSFTGSGYRSIRQSEESGKPNAHSDAILSAMKTATPEPGTVFRGIRGISKTVVDNYLKTGTFGLGPNMQGATSSTSWFADVAIDRFMCGSQDSYADYKILYVLKQKSGIPVETISSVGTSEHEVLLGRGARFRTTGISIAAGTERVLVIEAEEITEDVAPTGPTLKKPRRRKTAP